MLAQFRPLLWIVPFIAVFQLVFAGWQQALTSVGVLLVNVGLAALRDPDHPGHRDARPVPAGCCGRCAGSASTPTGSGCCWR